MINPEESKLASLSKEKKPRHFFPSNQTKSPIIGKQSSKLSPENSIRNSNNFDPSQIGYYNTRRYYAQQIGQSFDPSYNTIQVANETYQPGHGENYENNFQDMRSHTGFGMMHPGFDIRQGHNMSQSMNFTQSNYIQPMSVANLHTDPSHVPSHSYFNSPNREVAYQAPFENNRKEIEP